MRFLLRWTLRVLTHRLMAVLLLIALILFWLDSQLPNLYAIGIGLSFAAFMRWGESWLQRDAVRVDPYILRGRRRKAPGTPGKQPPPTGINAVPPTYAELQLMPPARPIMGDAPTMIARLPAALNRTVVEGLEAVARERETGN